MRLASRLLAVFLLGAGLVTLGPSLAAGAALYPGELVVSDASAFGSCPQGCGGLIAVDPATGAESALSANDMPVNAQNQLMGGPFTLALDANGDVIVGETLGLGGSCPGGLTCGGLVKVDPVTGGETLLSSNTMPINAASQYFGQVNGVTINQAGQILVSDWGGCVGCGKVIEVDPTNGKETLISANTMAINFDSQFLQYPQGLTIDSAGNIYVADALAFGSGGGIVEIDQSTGKQTELSSNELPVNATSQYFTGIGGLVFDSAGSILAADWGGGHNPGQIIQVDPGTGKESVFASNAMPVNAGTQYFNQPAGITIDQDGNVYVADEGAFCTLGCGGVIEVNPLTRAEQEISSNLMSLNSSSPLFAQPWDVAVVASSAPTIPGARPVNTLAPAIAGPDRQGETLTASPGTWSPAASSYTYSWQRSTDGGTSWTSIASASNVSYSPVSADLGVSLRVFVTATDASGQGTATSAADGPVASGAPSNTGAPKITGRHRVGKRLSADTGTWSPAATSYAYQWQRSTNRGRTWRNIAGATAARHVTGRVDAGAYVRAVVTASNAYGDATAASGRVGPLSRMPHKCRPRRSAAPSVRARC